MSPVVYATEALVTVLLELAKEREPNQLSTGLIVSPAGELKGAESLPSDVPVFTDFLLPDTGNAVNAVFGVELSTPARQSQGRFISHPLGELSVSKRDDLAEVILIAIPPWEPTPSSIRAFNRHGTRQPLELVDALPPEQQLDDE